MGGICLNSSCKATHKITRIKNIVHSDTFNYMIICDANIHSDIISLDKDKSGILLLEKNEGIK